MRTAVAGAVSLSLFGGMAANADTVLQYTFSGDAYYDFSGGSDNMVTGTFSYDVDTQAVTDVNYVRGSDTFTTGSLYGGDTRQIYFGDINSSDYDVYQLENPLDLGGTDTILSGSHPAIVIDAGGSVIGAGGVPEPASWALMLLGVGAVGGVARRRRVAPIATV